MQLPEILQQAIEQQVANRSLTSLASSSFQLSDRYRQRKTTGGFVKTEDDTLAYILARMPATYAAIHRVLVELSTLCPSFQPQSFLDLGSGPGTGLWAASDVFDKIQQFHAFEFEEKFISLAKKLVRNSSSLSKTIWSKKNLEIERDFLNSDLLLVSYVINEINEKNWRDFFSSLWPFVNHSLVIIEPGTKDGYARILKIREIILSLGGYLIAPCPQSGKCPLQQPDWCHFSARVERSSMHRKIKHADLNYEDEKFSYLIFSKFPLERPYTSRVLRHPQINKGYVKLNVCNNDSEFKENTYTKKDNEKYKFVKKIKWGDSY